MNLHYIKSTLTEKESIKKDFGLHWIVYVAPILFLILGLLSIVGSGMSFLTFTTIALFIYLHNKSIEQVLTNKRVVFKSGILSRKSDELKLSKIESVMIDQGILGRILGYGNIHISGTGTNKVILKYVTNPIITKTEIENIVDKS